MGRKPGERAGVGPPGASVTLAVSLALGVAMTARPAMANPPGSHHRSPHGRHGRRHSSVNLASYRARVRAWHDNGVTPAARHTSDGRLVLRLVSLNTRAVAEVTPQRQDGGFDEASCVAIAGVLEDASTHRRTAIDRRLIEVVYDLARHFNAGQVTVVSGYRADSRRSNHQLGRAVDVVLPGVSDNAVGAYARTLGMVGVGVYPTGGFVHVDVRTASYFWVDGSGPGRSRRLHEVHGDLARRADAAARARGVVGLGGTAGATDPLAARGDDGPTDGQTDGQTDGPTDGQTDGATGGEASGAPGDTRAATE